MPAQLVEEVGGGQGVNAGLAVLILATIQLKSIEYQTSLSITTSKLITKNMRNRVNTKKMNSILFS